MFKKVSVMVVLSLALFLCFAGCEKQEQKPKDGVKQGASGSINMESNGTTHIEYGEQNRVEYNRDPLEFVPAGYTLVEKIEGDLNKDGLDDVVLIIKSVNREQVNAEELMNEGEKRYRGGIIVAFKTEGGYERVLENHDCFSISEYYKTGQSNHSPLSWLSGVQIKNGNIHISMEYARRGDTYNFRYQNSNFELIGYDYEWPSGNESESINLLSGKAVTRHGSSETWKSFTIPSPVLLHKIEDFCAFNLKDIIDAANTNIPEGLEDMINTTIKALQNRDEAAINRLFHNGFGISIWYNPGAYYIIAVRNKISLDEPPSGYRFFPLGEVKAAPMDKIMFETLPGFSCDDEKWTKPAGIYSQAIDISQERFSPVSVAKVLIENDLPVSEVEMKIFEKLESINTHYNIIVINKTDDGRDFLNFNLTLIDGKWYLTMLNIIEPCSA